MVMVELLLIMVIVIEVSVVGQPKLILLYLSADPESLSLFSTPFSVPKDWPLSTSLQACRMEIVYKVTLHSSTAVSSCGSLLKYFSLPKNYKRYVVLSISLATSLRG